MRYIILVFVLMFNQASAEDQLAIESTCLVSVRSNRPVYRDGQLLYPGGKGTGTAIARGKESVLILTASHVVPDDSSDIAVAFNHGTYKAVFFKRDKAKDLALIYVRTQDPKSFPIAPIARTSVNPKQSYYIYGHPGGNQRQEQKIVAYKQYNEVNDGVLPGVSGSGVFYNGELYSVVTRSDFRTITVVVRTKDIREFVQMCTPWGCPPPRQPPPGQTLPPTLPPEPLPEQKILGELLDRLKALEGKNVEIDYSKIPKTEIDYDKFPKPEIKTDNNLKDVFLPFAIPAGLGAIGTIGAFGVAAYRRGKRAKTILSMLKSVRNRVTGKEIIVDNEPIKGKLDDLEKLLKGSTGFDASVLIDRLKDRFDRLEQNQSTLQNDLKRVMNRDCGCDDLAKAIRTVVLPRIDSVKACVDSLSDDMKKVNKENFLPQLPPREVSEINELLQLGQIEGRDPLLDAAFGMFAQDELQAKADSGDESAAEILRMIKARVDKAAPLSKESMRK